MTIKARSLKAHEYVSFMQMNFLHPSLGCKNSYTLVELKESWMNRTKILIPNNDQETVQAANIPSFLPADSMYVHTQAHKLKGRVYTGTLVLYLLFVSLNCETASQPWSFSWVWLLGTEFLWDFFLPFWAYIGLRVLGLRAREWIITNPSLLSCTQILMS